MPRLDIDKVFTGLWTHCRYGQHVSAQRGRSTVEPAHRSILPNVAGVPWWAALLVAISATVLGYAIDAGHKDLTHVFAGCYIAGCVVAVLAVRQSGLFTAVVQPPLILFCAVPGAYWLFHEGRVKKLKDLLINCGYPLIERFPLMLGTAGVVLLIGLIRWYFGMSQRPVAATDSDDDTANATGSKSVLAGLVAKLASMLKGDDGSASSTGAQAAHAVGRSARTRPKSGRTARSSRSTQRSARASSRHSRAVRQDPNEPTAERPRRQSRRGQPSSRDIDAGDPPRRSRRPRPQGDPDPRQAPREARRRGSYERPAGRSSRFDPYEPPSAQFSRSETPYDRYESCDAYEQPRRRATPSSAKPTHHPISQVRYRGSGEERSDEPRSERRSRSRAPRRYPAESWEYDI